MGIEIIAKINGIDIKTVKIQKFFYEKFINKDYPFDMYRTVEENFWLLLSPILTLRFSDAVIDSLILHLDELCKLKIENGMIQSLEPFKSEKEVLETLKHKMGIEIDDAPTFNMDAIMTDKPRSLRDKLQLMILTIVEYEKAGKLITDGELYASLEKNDISETESVKLLGQLVRDGMVYSPKPHYLKKS